MLNGRPRSRPLPGLAQSTDFYQASSCDFVAPEVLARLNTVHLPYYQQNKDTKLKSTFFAPAARRLTSFQPTIYRQARTVLALALTALILLPSLALTTQAHTVSSGAVDG